MSWYASQSIRPLHTYVQYLMDYGRGLVTQDPAPKLGLAALLAVLGAGKEVFGEAMAAVFVFWCADMLLGLLAAVRDPDVELQWGKALDGILRLIVILIVPALVNIAARFPDSISDGIQLGDRPALAVIGVFGAQEFISAVQNGIRLVPRMERWKARIIRWDPDNPTPRMSKGEVMVVREEEDDEGDEDPTARNRRKDD